MIGAESTAWHSYPSIFNLGHRVVRDILAGPVIVEEKVDGSQFSFGVLEDGTLRMRSKRCDVDPDNPGMFAAAVASVKRMAEANLLTPGWVYRAEYLSRPKHNVLAYASAPRGNLVLFDVAVGEEAYLTAGKEAIAEELGIDFVPRLFSGDNLTIERFEELLARDSFLGGAKIEGVVIKPANYDVFGPDKKLIIAKYVANEFREKAKQVHAKPGRADIIEALIAEFRTEARWQKALQHLRDDGKLEGSNRDIGALIPEIVADLERECKEEISERLWKHFGKLIKGGVVRGAAEWYKDGLLKDSFSTMTLGHMHKEVGQPIEPANPAPTQ